MRTNLFIDILDSKQKEIFQLLDFTNENFYLAGGTALALQIGHRKSIDFDFFSNDKFNTEELRIKIEEIFKGYRLVFSQISPSTINMVVDGVKMSFFYYPYKPLYKLVETNRVNIADLMDIACMKCSAITARSVKKDYIDLFFLLKKFSLEEILSNCERKFPSLDRNVILKSLVYFGEIEEENVVYMPNNGIDFSKIKKDLLNKVKAVF